MLEGRMPDLTKAQLVALVQAVIGVLVAFGLDVSQEKRDAILQLCTAALVVLPLADAYLRGKRATAVANVAAADVHAASLMAAGDTADRAALAEGDKRGGA